MSEGAKMERKVSARGLSLGEALNFFYSARATSHRERCDGDEISIPLSKSRKRDEKGEYISATLRTSSSLHSMFQFHGPEIYLYAVAKKFLRYLLCLILIIVLRNFLGAPPW